MKIKVILFILIISSGCGKKGDLLYYNEDNVLQTRPAAIDKDRVYRF